MELRIIDGQYFIASRSGKKESVLTPAEAKQVEQIAIEESKAWIAQLDIAIGSARRRLELELIDGVNACATRDELSALGGEVHGFQRDIDDAANRIKQVDRLIDQHTASSIQQADAAHLAAITAPFDTILKELA